jgi:hypothetical protein
LTQTLPTDRISFTKQTEIVRAFAAVYDKNNSPVSNDDVGRFINMAGSTVSQSNAMFVDVGLLQRAEAGKFIPTAPTLEYFKLHQFSPDRAWSKLSPLIERSWFGQELISKLKFRSIDENEAITDLALASNAEKGYEPQLKIAIEWLVQVGLAVREGTQLRIAPTGIPSIETPSLPGTAKPASPAVPTADSVEDGLFKSVLPLDASSKRRLVVWAPPTITKKELERVKAWLAVQIIVSDGDSTPSPQ